MASVMGIEAGGEEEVFTSDEAIPVWARGEVAAMYTLGVFESEGTESLTGEVTRANAASYLYRMLDVM